MDTSTYAGRVATAHQLRNELHRAPGDIPPNSEGPRGNCGRTEEGGSCGMIDPQECQIHADVPDGDPETMAFAGTLQERRRQLRAARRQGLRRQAR
jgi:hypothetical protein